MPYKAAKVCRGVGCKKATTDKSGYCADCKKAVHGEYNRHKRDKAVKALYGAMWRKASAAFLAANPLCRICKEQGKVVLAKEVDHIIPHKGDYDLFWDESNWQTLCKMHHSQKTAKEDGGFKRRERVPIEEEWVPSL